MDLGSEDEEFLTPSTPLIEESDEEPRSTIKRTHKSFILYYIESLSLKYTIFSFGTFVYWNFLTALYNQLDSLNIYSDILVISKTEDFLELNGHILQISKKNAIFIDLNSDFPTIISRFIKQNTNDMILVLLRDFSSEQLSTLVAHLEFNSFQFPSNRLTFIHLISHSNFGSFNLRVYRKQ